MTVYSDLMVTEYEEARSNEYQGGYKYHINGMYPYDAYVTTKGFNEWLQRTGLKLELVDHATVPDLGEIKIHKVLGVVKEVYFQTLRDIPTGAVKYKGLCNGSLVDCYCKKTTHGAVIFKPNPNSPEVYKPMPIDEHIEHQRVHG